MLRSSAISNTVQSMEEHSRLNMFKKGAERLVGGDTCESPTRKLLIAVCELHLRVGEALCDICLQASATQMI